MVDQSNSSNSNSSSEANSGAVSGIMRNRPGSVRPQAINIQAIDAEYESNNPYSKTTTKPSYTRAASSSSSPHPSTTPLTAASTPSSSSVNVNTAGINGVTPGIRGKTDIRSPGAKQTPQTENTKSTVDEECTDAPPVPSFITQTDQYGRATTPRIAHNNGGVSSMGGGVHSAQQIKQTDTDDTEDDKDSGSDVDPCDTLLESLRMMCCCILPDGGAATSTSGTMTTTTTTTQYVDTSNTGKNSPTVYPDRYSMNDNQMSSIKLLKNPLKKDQGKKCLVLDLDETLVHSSFRAVTGADFVIPVQIEDVVHFVYVAKRPGVDKFLSEMAKHFEIVVYTASLNKYADPLLDLLDPKGHIRYRLFRESCVYYDGNYVKDLSLINRDLSQSIIVDNSPASYIFHPDNAIDCSSFIDDPSDRELDQIGSFLAGVRDVKDVRKVCNMWREWPLIPHVDGLHFPLQGGDNGGSVGHGSGVVLDARDEQCPR